MKNLTKHLLNATVSQAASRMAAYYQRGSVVDPLSMLAAQVAGGEVTFSDALDSLLADYVAKGGDLDKIDAEEERLGNRLSALAERIQNGLADAPLAIIRPDVHPLVLRGLGLSSADDLLTADQINGLIAGRRADGDKIENRKYARERQLPTETRTGQRRWSTPIGSYDFCPTPHKSVSVGWAFAGEREKADIYNCHIEAAREAMRYLTDVIGVAGTGKNGREGTEKGHLFWQEFTHHTSRRTLVEVENGEVVVKDGGVPGDMNLHTHFLVTNAVFCESGRVGSIDTMGIRGFIFEVDAFYQARLGTKLRERGYAVDYDERTGAAKLSAVPEKASEQFSKRTRAGEIIAQKYTESRGEIWDGMSEEYRADRIKDAAQSVDQKTRGGKDDVADSASWRAQAAHIGWEPPKSFQFIGPPEAPLSVEQRARKAYEAGQGWLARRFEQNAVVPHWDLRVAALRGFVSAGIDQLSEIKGATRLMVREGIRHNGQKTELVYGPEDGKRYTSVTTGQHIHDEERFVELAKQAAADKSGVIPERLLRQAVRQSGLDFTGKHGEAMLQAVERAAFGGKFSVILGAAGSGKTTGMKPLGAAAKRQGRELAGSSLAWRQTDDLHSIGIDKRNLKAFSVMLKAIQDGTLEVGPKHIMVLDEMGLLGTKEGLAMMELRRQYGFTVVWLGDSKQAKSIMAGNLFDLSRRALGKDNIPEINTTVRQKTREEKQIAGLFREGRAAEGLERKIANGTAHMVYGGRDGVIAEVAKLCTERIREKGDAPLIVAPTNADAHQISEAVRQERRKLSKTHKLWVGPDTYAVKATDGTRDYDLKLATGDHVRLFESTRGRYDTGGPRSVGRNGSVLTVVRVNRDGLALKRADDAVVRVSWDDIKRREDGRFHLAYGDATTIHAGQGASRTGCIFAAPSGMEKVSGGLGYSALTRHEWDCDIVTSELAERLAVKASRPVNDVHEVTTGDKWAQVAMALASQGEKDSALSMLERVRELKRGSVKIFQDVHRPRQAPPVDGFVARRKAQIVKTITSVQQVTQRRGLSI